MQRHDSQRGFFAYELNKLMYKYSDIYLLMGDLGYGMFDEIRERFSNRAINVGAAEQAMVDIGIGLALENKIPICYSITPFLLYRPFESIRTYINHEKPKIILVGGGRDDDYKHDGWSHNASDVKPFMDLFKNIKSYYPENKEEITFEFVKKIIEEKGPCFLSLKR